MIDIIIPVYNEESVLSKFEEYYSDLKKKENVIFVDGGSTDETVRLAKQFGRVISASRGRACQMNEGAACSQGNILLFLHADTFLSDNALVSVQKAVDNGALGGCFKMRIDDRRLYFRFFEFLVNFRARYFKVFDGDLGLFVRRDVFNELKGFDNVSIMEDIYFARKLKQKGKTVVLPDLIKVSSREWVDKGFLKTLNKYTNAYIQFWMNKVSLNAADAS